MLPLPEGLFDQLSRQGDALLRAEAAGEWRALGDTRCQFPLYTRPADKHGEPSMCHGRGTFPYPLDEVVRCMVDNMPANSLRWDRTCQGVEVLHKWSDTDLLYRYIIDPGLLLAKRDMIYYEGWRRGENGEVVNVSASLGDPYDSICPLPQGWVRVNILLHYKRFKSVDGGRATSYETIQQISLGGWMPHALTTKPVTKGLRQEFNGFMRILSEDRLKTQPASM